MGKRESSRIIDVEPSCYQTSIIPSWQSSTASGHRIAPALRDCPQILNGLWSVAWLHSVVRFFRTRGGQRRCLTKLSASRITALLSITGPGSLL